MTTNYRLGIDAGGTFTDFVIANKTTGVTKLFKALSTPSNPTKAIENGLKLISDELGLSPEEVVSNCDLCINGTTVGLNALITHRGGKTGLICTAGHEDFDRDPQRPQGRRLPLRSGISCGCDAGAALSAQRRARARHFRRLHPHAAA